MKHIIQLSIIAGLSLLLGSCYKDKGNYDYHEINDIVITTDKYSYITPKEGTTTYEIKPTITQTMTTGTENLTYEWKMQKGALTWEVVGHDPTYLLTVTPSDTQPIVLRLAVTDTTLDIITYEEITVKNISKFNQTWFLLQDIGGQAVLGCVDGEDDARASVKDIYLQETGTSLTGKPIGLGMHNFLRKNVDLTELPNYEILLGVFTSSNPYILKGATLENHSFNYQRLLYEKMASSDNTFNPQLMKGDRHNFIIIDNGKLWYAFHDSFALMYPVELSDELGEEYEATGVGFASNNQCLIYDKLGKQFLNYNNNAAYDTGYQTRKQIAENIGTQVSYNLYREENANREAKLQSIRKDDASNKFDPKEDVPANYQIDFMGAASNININTPTILAVGHSGDNFYAYEFYPEAQQGQSNASFCNGMWIIPSQGNPAANALDNGKWLVTTSSYFIRMFFYAAGNTVYRVDLSQSTPAVEAIYETDPEDGPIKLMKIKSDNEDVAYEAEGTGANGQLSYKGITRHMGILQENEAGEAKLQEIHLTAAGEVELDAETKEPVVYRFDGKFENVVDMLFSFRDEI